MQATTTLKETLIKEIERQLEELNVKLELEVKISVYVKLLSEKRQLQSLLNYTINDK